VVATKKEKKCVGSFTDRGACEKIGGVKCHIKYVAVVLPREEVST